MKTLTSTAFERSRQFLLTQARPLEQALFAQRFEAAPAEKVLAELGKFQNPDGGFGHALEPDMRSPSSSALTTGIGLECLKELGCPANQLLVSQAVDYLLASFQREEQVWAAVPADANAYPHAPWWHDDHGDIAPRFDFYRVMPRARLVGLLWHFSTRVPAGWLEAVTEATVATIEALEVLGGGGGSDLEYAIELAETQALPEAYKDRLSARIQRAIPAAVERDPDKWDSYCITPLKVAATPHSLGAGLIPEELQLHLDYVIEHQSAEGTWDPEWSWFGSYPEEWEAARLEWRGILTLKTLASLQAFGRLEEHSR